jgi:hypothetical protein
MTPASFDADVYHSQLNVASSKLSFRYLATGDYSISDLWEMLKVSRLCIGDRFG